MAKLNPSFSRLDGEYIFTIIDRKLIELKKNIPAAELINLSIGDVTLPLSPTIVAAIINATQEMGTVEGIKGYPPTYGYDFLRNAIVQHECQNLNVDPEEIYISDGTNSDAVNIQELFHHSSVIGIANPTYPVYLSSSVIGGKNKRICLPCVPENQFIACPPETHCDLVYLCSPNNPTGTAMSRKDLQAWVDYARSHQAILFIDSAYSAFITSPEVPKSIYEIEGAHECAIELKSFSKSAGFTGLRCAYTILPKTVAVGSGRKKLPLHKLWEKRQGIKFNGVAYPIQRGAQAALSSKGRKEVSTQVQFYLSLARRLKEGLIQCGHTCWGGSDSPYIWWKTPKDLTSWQFFDHLLNTCHLIATPGRGFGSLGEGYIRLSAFSSEEKITLALKKIKEKV